MISDEVWAEVAALVAVGSRKLYMGRWLDRHPDHELALGQMMLYALKDYGSVGVPDDLDDKDLFVCGLAGLVSGRAWKAAAKRLQEAAA